MLVLVSNSAKLFIRMNKMHDTSNISERLQSLGFENEEALIYIELLKGPKTCLGISRAAGVNRTKVYRLIDKLEKDSLISSRTDDRGVFWMACDPQIIDAKLERKEQKIKIQRDEIKDLLPVLLSLQSQDDNFFVKTHKGEAGYKQMCWHEQTCQGDLLCLGNGTIEDLVSDKIWCERHRLRQVERKYRSLEIINPGQEMTCKIPSIEMLFDAKLYEGRTIDPGVIKFDGQTIIYNNTVAIYNWKHEQKIGIEIVNKSYANMMRQIFYNYWSMAKPQK